MNLTVIDQILHTRFVHRMGHSYLTGDVDHTRVVRVATPKTFGFLLGLIFYQSI